MNKTCLLKVVILAMFSMSVSAQPLGLPPLPIPENNPQSPEKIQLGDKLYHDKRFSADGKVSCATCHAKEKGFTDNLKVSKGFMGKQGTRNAPTVINAAYMKTQFWDGREPDLEGQSKGPPINPVEGGLKNHKPILAIIKKDKEYQTMFDKVFDVEGDGISMEHVSKAIASFERTIIAGNSPFDQFQYGGDKSALSASQKRGLTIFKEKGRCVSCHVIEQTQALFTDNRFHNIGIGFKKLKNKESKVASAFLQDKHKGVDVDVTVLTNENMSELGRFAVTENPTQVGAFKTSTLRNIAVTKPYMHDGSLKTLEDVIDFYNNGGRVKENDPVSGFQSGGIRPLDLTKKEKKDLVNFLKALTSPEFSHLAKR